MTRKIKNHFDSPDKAGQVVPPKREVMRRIAALGVMCMLLFAVVSCRNAEEEFILLTVSAELNYTILPCENPRGFVVGRQMIVSKYGSAAEQELGLNAIKGFTHVNGYEYLLKVRTINDNNARFSLMETVSKTKKFEEEIVLLNVSIDWLPHGPGGELIEVLSVTQVDFTPPHPGYSGIPILEGFEPEHGFDYLIEVTKNTIHTPPTTGVLHFFLYSFIEIISQTPKTN